MPVIDEDSISVLRVFANDSGSITITEIDVSSDDHRRDIAILVGLDDVDALCQALKSIALQIEKERQSDA